MLFLPFFLSYENRDLELMLWNVNYVKSQFVIHLLLLKPLKYAMVVKQCFLILILEDSHFFVAITTTMTKSMPRNYSKWCIATEYYSIIIFWQLSHQKCLLSKYSIRWLVDCLHKLSKFICLQSQGILFVAQHNLNGSVIMSFLPKIPKPALVFSRLIQ